MRKIILLVLFLMGLSPSLAEAAASPWQRTDEVAVRLISANKGTQGLETLTLGLDVALADEWHTYWRSPGPAGEPPALSWDGSTNFENATLLYPAPQRIAVLGMDTIGYKGHVLFPITAKIQKANEPVSLKLKLTLLVCNTLCVPKDFVFSLELPVQSGLLGPESALLSDAIQKVPSDQNDKVLISQITRNSTNVSVTVQGTEPLQAPDLFLEASNGLTFAAPQKALSADGRTATFTFALDGQAPQGISLATVPLTITAVDGDKAVEKKSDGNETNASQTQEPSPTLSLRLLLLSLFGGLLLNFMPCVLPVLSLKVMGLLHAKKQGTKALRFSFIGTAAGIWFSFLLLALATAGLKATGQAVGWGMQFQHPAFLVFMIFVVTFFAANLWGFFEIGTAQAVGDLANAQKHPKLAGSFATGALATLLATPCSAPFLGTAVTFAMTATFTHLIAIFLALGLGMSLPYLGLAAWPRLANLLPKPGAWMTLLSRVLGFCLAGTALWLLYVLNAQAGLGPSFVIGALAALLLIGLYLRHRGVQRQATGWGVLVLALGALAFISSIDAPQQTEGPWQKFDEAALAQHVKDGQTVFVDVTADWCVTCKFNKRFALGRAEVQKRLQKEGIVALEADWTNPDAAVTAFLQRHGRYGVPFAIVYGPQAPNGLPLPELLTPDDVLKALDKAQGTKEPCATDVNQTSC